MSKPVRPGPLVRLGMWATPASLWLIPPDANPVLALVQSRRSFDFRLWLGAAGIPAVALLVADGALVFFLAGMGMHPLLAMLIWMCVGPGLLAAVTATLARVAVRQSWRPLSLDQLRVCPLDRGAIIQALALPPMAIANALAIVTSVAFALAVLTWAWGGLDAWMIALIATIRFSLSMALGRWLIPMVAVSTVRAHLFLREPAVAVARTLRDLYVPALGTCGMSALILGTMLWSLTTYEYWQFQMSRGDWGVSMITRSIELAISTALPFLGIALLWWIGRIHETDLGEALDECERQIDDWWMVSEVSRQGGLMPGALSWESLVPDSTAMEDPKNPWGLQAAWPKPPRRRRHVSPH